MQFFLQNLDQISSMSAFLGAGWYMLCFYVRSSRNFNLQGLLVAAMAAGNAPIAPALVFCVFDRSLLAQFDAAGFHLTISAIAITWFTFVSLTPKNLE